MHLDAFLERGLAELAAWDAPTTASGLALEYLAYHTTPLGTARERAADEADAVFPQARATPAPGLRARCTALHLLAERADETSAAGVARLGHDTLAPLVRERVERSEAPGPRARRTLEARAADWADGRDGAPLDEHDLAVVEDGAAGMRAWTPDEARLVDASRAVRTRRRRERLLVRRAGAALALLVVLLGAFGWWSAARARDRAALAESVALATRAGELMVDEPDLALVAAVTAMERRATPQARLALLEASRRARHLAMALPGAPVAGFTRDGAWVVHDGRALVRHDPATGRADTLATGAIPGLDSALAGAVAPDGRMVVAVVRDAADGAAVLVMHAAGGAPAVLGRTPPRNAFPSAEFARSVAFSADGRRFAALYVTARHNRLLVWTRAATAGDATPRLAGAPDTVDADWGASPRESFAAELLALSPTGRWAAVVALQGHAVAVAIPAAGARRGEPATRAVTRLGELPNNAFAPSALGIDDAGLATLARPTYASAGGPPIVVQRWDAARGASAGVAMAEPGTAASAGVPATAAGEGEARPDGVTPAWVPLRRDGTDTLTWFALAADGRSVAVGDHRGRVVRAPLLADSAAAAEMAATADRAAWPVVEGLTHPDLLEGILRVTVSPDGRWLALGAPWAERTTIWEMPPARPAPLALPSATTHRLLALTPDATGVLVLTETETWPAGPPVDPPDTAGEPLRRGPPIHAMRGRAEVATWILRVDRRTGAVDTLGGGVLGPPVTSPDGRWLATAVPRSYDTPEVLRWRLDGTPEARRAPPDTLEVPDSIPGRPDLVLAVADDGATYLVAGPIGDGVSVWSLDAGRPGRRLVPPDASAFPGRPVKAAVDVRRGCLLVANPSNRLRGWSLADGAADGACSPPPGNPEEATTPASMQAAGGRVTLVADDGSVAVWDLAAGRHVAVLPPGSADRALLDDGDWLRVARLLPGPGARVEVDSVAIGGASLVARACRLLTAARARWAAAASDLEPLARCDRGR